MDIPLDTLLKYGSQAANATNFRRTFASSFLFILWQAKLNGLLDDDIVVICFVFRIKLNIYTSFGKYLVIV